MRPCANAECGKELREGQGRFCSNPCRIAGMRQAKAAKLQPDDEPQYHPPEAVQVTHDDWRRPKADREARESWHRRPPGWA